MLRDLEDPSDLCFILLLYFLFLNSGSDNARKNIQATLVLPYAFGMTTPFITHTVYFKKTVDGIGLKVKNIDGRVVVRGFRDFFDRRIINAQVNDVVLSCNSLDARATSFDKILSLLRAPPQQEKTSVGLAVVDETVCVRLARPVLDAFRPVGYKAAEEEWEEVEEEVEEEGEEEGEEGEELHQLQQVVEEAVPMHVLPAPAALPASSRAAKAKAKGGSKKASSKKKAKNLDKDDDDEGAPPAKETAISPARDRLGLGLEVRVRVTARDPAPLAPAPAALTRNRVAKSPPKFRGRRCVEGKGKEAGGGLSAATSSS